LHQVCQVPGEGKEENPKLKNAKNRWLNRGIAEHGETGFYKSLHELRSAPGMKTTGRSSRVRRTIEDEEEDEKEKDHLQWA
jgi:hypothetical protein